VKARILPKDEYHRLDVTQLPQIAPTMPLNISPGDAFPNSVNAIYADLELSSHRCARSIRRSDFANLPAFQFGIRVAFAFQGYSAPSPLAIHVVNIVLGSPNKKVTRVHAEPDVTFVENVKGLPVHNRDFSVDQEPREPVGFCHRTWEVTKGSVASSSFRSFPKPAFIRLPDVYLTPKAFSGKFVDIHKHLLSAIDRGRLGTNSFPAPHILHH